MHSVFLFTIALISLNGFGADKMARFNLKGYPKTHRECQAAASTVAQQFATATGVTILLSKCERNRALSYDLQIQYKETGPLDLVSSSAWPVYSSIEKCLANLDIEETTFKENTGLSPFLQYCADYLEVSNGWEKAQHRYTPLFYAIGKAKTTTHTFSLHMNEGTAKKPEQITQEIVNKTKATGLNIVDAHLDLRKGDSELWFKFISKGSDSDVDFKTKFLLKSHVESFHMPNLLALDVDPMVSESLRDCETQRSRATSLFANSFSSPVVWFCMWDSNVFKARLQHLRINVGEEGFDQFEPGDDGEPFSNDFASNSECENAKPRVVDHYKQKLGERVIGGLCSWNFKTKEHLRVKMFIYAAQDY